MLPPVALISFAVKSLDDSDRVIVNVAVSPTFNEGTSEAIPIVGAVSSAVVKDSVVVSLIPA